MPVFATFVTTEGTFKARLFDQEAPKTVENFVGLAEGTKDWTDPRSNQKVRQPYYDGVIFHRVIGDFMIQGGCPTGTGTGGPGYTIKAEFNDTPHVAGVLSMARTNDPDSAGSQFFICTGTHTHLDRSYTAFGKVADDESMKTVKAIASVKVGGNDRPKEDVKITKATVTEAAK